MIRAETIDGRKVLVLYMDKQGKPVAKVEDAEQIKIDFFDNGESLWAVLDDDQAQDAAPDADEGQATSVVSAIKAFYDNAPDGKKLEALLQRAKALTTPTLLHAAELLNGRKLTGRKPAIDAIEKRLREDMFDFNRRAAVKKAR